jgi:hypothetical protein
LSPHIGAISPDRGKSCNKSNRTGYAHPGIPRRVRYLVRYLACAWLGGRCGIVPSRAPGAAPIEQGGPDGLGVVALADQDGQELGAVRK